MPIRTRVVSAASRASCASASGEGLGDATWPPTHRASNGCASSSATVAGSTAPTSSPKETSEPVIVRLVLLGRLVI